MFMIRIATDNQAFRSMFCFKANGEYDLDPEAKEVRGILQKVSQQLKSGYTEGVCLDSNGNNVGTWRYKDED